MAGGTLTRWIAGVSVLSAAAFFTPAHAAQCGPADSIDSQLRAKYREAPVGAGVTVGRLVLLYTSRDGSTWTVTMTDPQTGLMCIVAAGESWAAVERPPEGDPS